MKRFRNGLAIFAAGLVLLTSNAHALPLVANGGFETGDFTGWVTSGNYMAVDSYASSGSYGARLGTGWALGSLSQTILITDPGAYLLNFQLANSGSPSEFIATVNGITLLDIKGGGWQPYTQYSLTFTTDQQLNEIKFFERNDPGALHLDDVNVEPVPEPSTFLLFGAGLLGAGVLARFRRLRSGPRLA